jgi:hypothetical protein
MFASSTFLPLINAVPGLHHVRQSTDLVRRHERTAEPAPPDSIAGFVVNGPYVVLDDVLSGAEGVATF